MDEETAGRMDASTRWQDSLNTVPIVTHEVTPAATIPLRFIELTDLGEFVNWLQHHPAGSRVAFDPTVGLTIYHPREGA